MGFLTWTTNKLNPAQARISSNGTATIQSNEGVTYSYQQCYEQLEVVNRAVNMIVDDVAAIKNKVGEPIPGTTSYPGIRKKTLDRLLNKEPNPFQDIDSFKRNMLMDLLLEGNIFLYFDGVHLYHLPATKMVIHSDKRTFVSHYSFEDQDFKPDEIIHVKENSYKTIYRGSSRLEPALRTMRIIIEMRNFQDNFFKNGAVPGLVLKSKDTLNERLKKRLTDEWSKKYRPGSGGKRPIILDGGLEIDTISNNTFAELDFQGAIVQCEETVLKAIGVPPILLDTGNNANLRPNHRLFYLETVIPIVNKLNSALAKFFGFEIFEDITYIEALRPELKDQASYLQSLVNGGIMTPNEARAELDKPPIAGHDDLRIPANIAGSAANPSVGGAPKKEEV